MRPPRFSIASLLAFTGACGIGFAALHSPSYLWANTVFTITLGALVVAAINVVFGRARRRAFWAGFLIVGGTYFTIYAVPVLRESVGPRLVTEAALDFLYPYTAPTPPAPPATATIARWVGGPSRMRQAMLANQDALQDLVIAMGTVDSPPPVSRWTAWTTPDRGTGVGYPIGTIGLVSSEPFRQIGHSLLTLLFASLGGLYARRRFDADRTDGPPIGAAP
jgi:hypothetical protein